MNRPIARNVGVGLLIVFVASPLAAQQPKRTAKAPAAMVRSSGEPIPPPLAPPVAPTRRRSGARPQVPMPTTTRAPVIRIYHVKHVAPEKAEAAIANVVGVRTSIDGSSNQLIVSGTPEELAVVEALLVQLDSESAAKTPEQTTLVYKLRHRSPEKAVAVLADVLQARRRRSGHPPFTVVPDQQSGSIIARGSAEDQERLKQFLAVYDQPGSETTTGILPIRHRSARELIGLLNPIIGPMLQPATMPSKAGMAGTSGLSVTADDVTQSLLVRGTQEQIDSVKQMVGQLDQPRPSLLLTFYFIKSGESVHLRQTASALNLASEMVKAEDAAGGKKLSEAAKLKAALEAQKCEPVRPLPQQLSAVARALGEYGFEHPALLASMVVRTDVTDQFNASGMLKTAAGDLNLTVRGRVSLGGAEAPDKASASAQLQLEAEVAGERHVRSGASQRERLFQVEGGVTVPLGEYAIVATAPCDAAAQSMALVVRAEDGAMPVGAKK
jgi:hypothetical protein